MLPFLGLSTATKHPLAFRSCRYFEMSPNRILLSPLTKNARLRCPKARKKSALPRKQTDFQRDLEEIVTFARDFTTLNVVIASKKTTPAQKKKALVSHLMVCGGSLRDLLRSPSEPSLRTLRRASAWLFRPFSEAVACPL